MNDKDWFAALCRMADGVPARHDPPIPPFPEADIQTRTTGAAGAAGLAEVWQFYLDCRDMFRATVGRDLTTRDRMLDFGCGWGRIARLFLNDIDRQNIHGTDVNPDLVAECAARFANGNFVVNSAFPPSSYPAGSFDLITGFSVYSHLSEAASRAWMEEFARLCRPGGLICMTTRGRSFFDYCEGLRETAAPGTYPHHLSMMFDDFDEARARYDAGEFVHSNARGVTGGGVLRDSFYGETFIPRAYAETGFGPSVRCVGWLDGGLAKRQHPVMFFSPI